MIVVVGQFRLAPDALASARPAMARVIEITRAEAGCLEYSYAEDMSDPGLIRVAEVWTSREALSAHIAAPHMARWKEERAAFGMSGRAVTAYAVSGSEAL